MLFRALLVALVLAGASAWRAPARAPPRQPSLATKPVARSDALRGIALVLATQLGDLQPVYARDVKESTTGDLASMMPSYSQATAPPEKMAPPKKKETSVSAACAADMYNSDCKMSPMQKLAIESKKKKKEELEGPAPVFTLNPLGLG